MKQERLIIVLLAAIHFTNIMDFMIIMPLGPSLMRSFHITPRQFSNLVSAYTISAGIFGLVASFFIDRYDRKLMLLLIYTGFIAGTLSCALASGYKTLLLCRVLTGAFGGVLGALVLAIVGDIIPFERRASAIGSITTAFSLASVLGVPFGLYLATKFTMWTAPFYLLTGLGLVLLILVYIKIPSIRIHMEQAGEGIRKSSFSLLAGIFKNKSQVSALLLMFTLIMGQFAVIPFISPYMVFNVKFKESQLAYIYLLGGGATIFTARLIGIYADRKGKYRVFRTFALLSVIPLFVLTNMGHAKLALALAVTTVFFIVVSGRMIPAMALITSTVDAKYRGSFMSINTCVQQLSAGIASLLAGAVIVKGKKGELLNFEYVGFFAIALTLLAIWAAWRIKLPETQNKVIEKPGPLPAA